MSNNTNAVNVERFNSVKKMIAKAPHKKRSANCFILEVGERKVALNFRLPKSITVTDDTTKDVLYRFDVTVKEHVVNLVAIVKKAQRLHNNGATTSTKVPVPSKKPTPVNEPAEAPTKPKKKGAQKMSAHVNGNKMSTSLIKKGWTLDKDGILTNEKGNLVVRFNEKSVRIHNSETSTTVTPKTAFTTDAQFVEYLQAVAGGKKPKVTQTKGLSTPDEYPAPKPNAVEKEDTSAPTPKDPVNPNEDGSTPVFAAVNEAIAIEDKAETAIAGAWQPIAEQFDYSIANLTRALFLEGKWPAKKDKNGKFMLEEDGTKKPAGYQGVYKAERESGVKGIGYMANRANRMFAKYNPKLRKDPNESTGGGSGGVTPTTSTHAEKKVEDILIEMSKHAKALSAEDLRSWLETDPSVQPILAEMMSDGSLSGIEEEADLVDPELVAEDDLSDIL